MLVYTAQQLPENRICGKNNKEIQNIDPACDNAVIWWVMTCKLAVY
jgi:hypothetical protein